MIGYLVTFRSTAASRMRRNLTVTVFADSEHEAAELLRQRVPGATVLATTHPES